jgi:hypothetical protein
MKLSAIGAVLVLLASLGLAASLGGCSCDHTDPKQMCLPQ